MRIHHTTESTAHYVWYSLCLTPFPSRSTSLIIDGLVVVAWESLLMEITPPPVIYQALALSIIFCNKARTHQNAFAYE